MKIIYKELIAGQLIWVDLPKNNLNPYSPIGKRPAIVLNYSPTNSPTVQIVPISTNFKIKGEVLREVCRIEEEELPYDSLTHNSYLRFDAIQTISKSDFIYKVNMMAKLWPDVDKRIKEKLVVYNKQGGHND